MATALVVSFGLHAAGKDAKLVSRFAYTQKVIFHRRNDWFTVSNFCNVIFRVWLVKEHGCQGSPSNLSLFLCQILHKLAFVCATPQLHRRYSVSGSLGAEFRAVFRCMNLDE